MRFLITSATVLCTALISAAPGFAQDLPNSLQGELLFDPGFAEPAQATCTDGGPGSTIKFSGDGAATGPYNGTFVESGTITLGGLDQAPFPDSFAGQAGLQLGQATEVDTSFRIDSLVPPATVTGTKTIFIPTGGEAFCGTFTGRDVLGLEDADGEAYAASSNVNYEATITTPAGRFKDTGRGALFVQDISARTPSIGRGTSGMGEFFSISNGVLPDLPGKPGCGIGDVMNHFHIGPPGQDFICPADPQNGGG